MSEDADRVLAKYVIGALVRPAWTFRALGEQKGSSPGLAAVALLGLFWSLLLALLWMNGERPSFVLLPIPRDLYYATQAVLMTPVLTALFWIHSEIAHRICARANGAGPEPGVRAALGFAYGVPMLFAHVLPELIAYTTSGFDTMSQIGRFTLPIAATWVWILSAAALRVVHRVSTPRAIAASFAGLFVQALAGAVVIR